MTPSEFLSKTMIFVETQLGAIVLRTASTNFLFSRIIANFIELCNMQKLELLMNPKSQAKKLKGRKRSQKWKLSNLSLFKILSNERTPDRSQHLQLFNIFPHFIKFPTVRIISFLGCVDTRNEFHIIELMNCPY